MSELFRIYGTYLFDLLIFVMVFLWFYCGSGGTHDNKTKFGRFGIPSIAGIVVVLITYGMGAFDGHLEKGKCEELPAGTGVMSNDRCYKRIDGPVYVPVDTNIYKAE